MYHLVMKLLCTKSNLLFSIKQEALEGTSDSIQVGKNEVLEAFRTIGECPGDLEAKAIITRFENHHPQPRMEVKHVQEILARPEYADFKQFARSLPSDLSFHQIYGYMPQKASMMHNVVLRAISIHRGIKRANANPRFAHKGILLHGPSGRKGDFSNIAFPKACYPEFLLGGNPKLLFPKNYVHLKNFVLISGKLLVVRKPKIEYLIWPCH